MGGLAALYDDLDAPRTLHELGMRQQDLAEATDLILGQVPGSNPRAVDCDSLGQLLRGAWAGERPQPV